MSRSLFRFERVWAKAALDAIYPSSASKALPLGISLFDVDGFFDDLLVRIPLLSSLGLRAAIWLVALAPLFVLHRVATIKSLGSGDRSLLIQRLLGSQRYAVRQLVFALKATGGLLYGNSPIVRSQVLHVPPADMRSNKLRLPMLGDVEGKARKVAHV